MKKITCDHAIFASIFFIIATAIFYGVRIVNLNKNDNLTVFAIVEIGLVVVLVYAICRKAWLAKRNKTVQKSTVKIDGTWLNQRMKKVE